MKLLENKTAIITGSTKGIGKGIAKVFASHGAAVAITGRDRNKGLAFAQELKSSGFTAEFFDLDVTSEESTLAMVNQVAEKFQNIDILCANAGIFPASPFESLTPDHWDEVFNVNLKGMFLSIKACLPHLKKSPAGRIILTSSITGPITGYPGWSHYGATKAGMLGFMRTTAIEFAKYNITVNAILPGNILTEGLSDLGEDYIKSMASSIPLKRLGTVEEIGNAAAFLASDLAAYITGHPLVVDGGQILPESLQALEAA